jgi:hypothetical protein
MSIIIHYFAGKSKENKTEKEGGTYGGDEGSIESFVGKTRRKETT